MSKEEIIKLKNEYSTEFKKFLVDMTGVACFTHENSNIQMWGHYADSFKGICVEYKIPKSMYCTMLEVKYSSEPSKISNILNAYGEIRCDTTTDDIIEWFSVKHINWEYENEVRFMNNPAHIELLDDENVKAIYFGVNCSIKDKERVLESVNDFEDIKFFEMDIQAGSYNIEFTKKSKNDILKPKEISRLSKVFNKLLNTNDE